MNGKNWIESSHLIVSVRGLFTTHAIYEWTVQNDYVHPTSTDKFRAAGVDDGKHSACIHAYYYIIMI